MTPNRRPDTGLQRPYRDLPQDFRETFLRLGQSKEIEEHYRTNWRVIRRWIEEAGGDDLRAERAQITGNVLHPRRRSSVARNYVRVAVSCDARTAGPPPARRSKPVRGETRSGSIRRTRAPVAKRCARINDHHTTSGGVAC